MSLEIRFLLGVGVIVLFFVGMLAAMAGESLISAGEGSPITGTPEDRLKKVAGLCCLCVMAASWGIGFFLLCAAMQLPG